MPEYASFRISLQSQYDAATIPESSPQVTTVPAPILRALHCESPALREQHPDKTFDDFQRGCQHMGVVIETTVPALKGSQFWICYSCPPPPSTAPPSDSEEEGDAGGEVKYYYFKLFVSGKCLLSWGVGEQDDWKGKMIFGLFDGGRDFEGRRIVEKRGLFFPSDSTAAGGAAGEGFEIRVFRAKARKREVVRYLGLGEMLGAGGGGKKAPGLEFTSVGKVQKGERQRFYSYALIDAKEEPWLVFKYRFEREGEGQSGLRFGAENEMSDADEKAEETAIESTMLGIELEDMTITIDSDLEATDEPVPDAAESSLWSDLEQNTPPQPQQNLRTTTISNDKTIRRLSFPPRNPLHPSTSRIEPSSPIKQLASASDDDLARSRVQDVDYSTLKTAEMPRRTGLRKEGWTVRAASPEKGRENGEQEGLQGHKKVGSGSASSTSAGLLKSVVAGALRRREKDERVR